MGTEITITISLDLAQTIIEAVGGRRDDRQCWIFPGDAWFWRTDEALTYALTALPTIFDAMAKGKRKARQ